MTAWSRIIAAPGTRTRAQGLAVVAWVLTPAAFIVWSYYDGWYAIFPFSIYIHSKLK